ncbi:S49 family peptidase [Thiohalocapsa sp. ML1]|jgi:protease IV|uniref:S49 family peptidase n=1 Tax=Thiohalocapsa sp. ML1 TaxID=1431688 RepID=UPI000ADA664E|nr:S49 family peptidase [Thiohalocapsa sp. ML1]
MNLDSLKFWKPRDPARDEHMPAPGDPDWERALINRMAAEFLREQRRSRRWGTIFRFGILAYLLLIVAAYYANGLGESLTAAAKHTALVDVKGAIAADGEASADRIITALRKAFEADRAKAVILRINSPGGSPVQSGYVFKEIRRLREKHPDKKVYAVGVDTMASGAYYIAAAADEIYVDEATLVGSIGVRLDSFGFQRAMEELGIQRRLLTAGERKGMLDPFSPLAEQDREFLQGLLDNMHAQFIDAVKTGRGDRLNGGDELFSGLFWTGQESLGLGLSDGIGSASYVAREIVGAEDIVAYSTKRDLLERLTERFGAGLARGFVASGWDIGAWQGLPQLR